MSQWWKKGVSFPNGDKNFLKIIEFFLFECPVVFPKSKKRVSQRAKSLEEHGWQGDTLRLLLTNMKNNASNHLIYSKGKAEDFDVVKQTENCENTTSLSDRHFEMMYFIVHNELKETRTIFYYIRNAFAHGSFSVYSNNDDPIYYLENMNKGKVYGRFRLKEKTLLKWINLFNSTPEKLKSKNKKKRKQKNKSFS